MFYILFFFTLRGSDWLELDVRKSCKMRLCTTSKPFFNLPAQKFSNIFNAESEGCKKPSIIKGFKSKTKVKLFAQMYRRGRHY